MRELPHDEVLDILDERGYSTEWVDDYDRTTVDNPGPLADDVSTAGALDWWEVEGQVLDGLFEDPNNGPPFDFSYLLTEHANLVGRMMYYMVSMAGEDYTFADLVDDVATLADEYGAAFDRERVADYYRQEGQTALFEHTVSGNGGDD